MNNSSSPSPQVQQLPWVTVASISHVGKVRQENQDEVLVKAWPNESALLAVVADGMGGGRGGQRAAELTIESFEKLVSEPLATSEDDIYQQLLEKFYEADEAIRNEGGQSFQLMGMGSTVVAAIITPDYYVHLYAGDSRLYHLQDNEPLYKTKDHSIVRVLLEIGKITPEQVATHPMRSQVTSCLGGRDGNGQFSIDPKWQENPSPLRNWQDQDILILSSDGLHNYFRDEEIQQLKSPPSLSPEDPLNNLLETALERGGQDNISAILIIRKPQN
ncbi:MAG: serine/threonine-protein phosphatase [Phormidium sp. BM_Day4_Bin.17]|nr:serine/threonine-protein phosphatase [Phormidium sp. BM_Day4_Bin.17]UCJ13805.1 MAG: serine/threonine-protein phosphatase [Phormidium sp. PBR-2020]